STSGNWGEISAQLEKNMFPTGKIIFSNWKPKFRGLSQKTSILSQFYDCPPIKAQISNGKMF
ncbi:MAG: hypothetical protein J6R98_00735, partial [Bacteroidaceae bacterium]|nr:hypothetical protein [Bacteroidaceae bacterium]